MATPLTEERVDSSVGKLQVLRGGSGPPLVYLHSAMGEVSVGMLVLEDLADGLAVTAPVFPGFGESEGIEHVDDIEDAAFLVLDLLDQLGVERPALVGLSLGAWMAAEVATRWPQRLSAVVLINPVGLYLPDTPIPDMFGKPPNELAAMVFADQSHPVALMMQALAERYDDPAAMADIPMEVLVPLVKSTGATAKIGWDPYLHNPKLGRRLHRITVPTLVVHGAADAFVPRAHSEAFAAAIPGARLVDLEGAGHLAPLEKPAEVAALVRAFLDSV